MATFGNTNVETDIGWSDWGDHKFAGKFALSESALVSQLTACIGNTFSGHAATHARAIIYADDAGEPGALLAMGVEVDIVDNYGPTGPLWCDFLLSSVLAIEPGAYWLGLVCDTSSAGLYIRTALTGGNGDFAADDYSDGSSDPWGAEHNARTRLLSIYATYTPTASGASYMTTKRGMW